MGEYNDIWDEVVWPSRSECQARGDVLKHVNSCRAAGVSPASRPCVNRWGDEISPCILALALQLLEKAAVFSVEAVELDRAAPRLVPAPFLTEFQPLPRQRLRGLEVTLAPKLLPVPFARSCRV